MKTGRRPGTSGLLAEVVEILDIFPYLHVVSQLPLLARSWYLSLGQSASGRLRGDRRQVR